MSHKDTKKICIEKCNKEPSFFTQFICEENIVVPHKKPDIEDIVSVIVDPEIVSLRIINTPIGCSAEGQKLTGKKLSIEIKMRQKIVYISKTEKQSVHVVENEFYKSTYIIVPKLIYGSDVEHLLNQKYIDVDVKVENTSAIKVDERNIYKNVILFISAKVKCSYLLCYTEDCNCHSSKLYISYENGTKIREIACFDKGKILMPKWSPCGQRIAYIYREKNSSCIYLSDIKGNYTYELTNTDVYKYVTNFSWSPDGRNIVFTAFFKGNKDIFTIDLNTLECKQLTYGKCGCKSTKPKCSFDGEYIGYMRLVDDNKNLYIMKKNGLGTKRITKLDKIKDFAWENNNLGIAIVHDEYINDNKKDYFLDCEKKGNEIILVDLKFNEEINLNLSRFNLKIRNIKFSNDDRYISFIGENLGFEDIYVYDLIKNILINVTENEEGVNISDYDWKIDSSGIYYSCDELNYYNVFFVYICDKTKIQISNTKASNMKLSYRPKIL